MAYFPDVFGPVMASLLNCAETALDDNGRSVGKVFLNPGAEVPWDNCCENEGQVWVRMIQTYATAGRQQPFPHQDLVQDCGINHLAVVLGVGVIRCVSTVNDRRGFPTGQEMTRDALAMTADASILLGALDCCFRDSRVPSPRIGAWTPLGPRGGCAGGEWQVTVGVSWCGCDLVPPDPEPGDD